MSKFSKIASFLAGGIALSAASEASENRSEVVEEDSLKDVVFRPLNSTMPLYLAAHRSHSSHSSHSSHRSSSGSSYTPRTTPSRASQPQSQPSRPAQSYTAPKSTDKLESVKNDKDKMKNIIMRVQLTLQSLGYYSGSIDGIMGPMTREAINTFRSAKGLRQHDKLDTETLNALAITVY